MPIHFRCQACGQPIEVDDAGAGQQVVCPFCRETGPAPTISDPTIQYDVPAADLHRPSDPQTDSTRFGGAVSRPSRSNVLGWLALMSVGISVVCIAIILIYLVPIATSLDTSMEMDAFQKELQKRLESHGGLVFLSTLGWLIAPIAGVALGVAALVRRTTPRWPGIVGLCLSAILMAMMCMGILLSFSIQGTIPS